MRSNEENDACQINLQKPRQNGIVINLKFNSYLMLCY